MSKIVGTLLMIFVWIGFVSLLFGCSGCKLLESATSDISGWDISACVSDFDTCWELSPIMPISLKMDLLKL